MRDPWGVKCRNVIGVDILIWGSDFAHATGDWPDCRSKLLDETFAGVAADERKQMVCDNAIEYFKLDPALDLDRFGRALQSQEKAAG